jgi:hypothetical protein
MSSDHGSHWLTRAYTSDAPAAHLSPSLSRPDQYRRPRRLRHREAATRRVRIA